VIAGAAVAPRVVEQFVVGLEMAAGQALFPVGMPLTAPSWKPIE
jgi:hypothetical protein